MTWFVLSLLAMVLFLNIPFAGDYNTIHNGYRTLREFRDYTQCNGEHKLFILISNKVE